MFKIVFSDADGTLLTNERHISPLTLKSVFALKEAHIPFVIVSARSPAGIYPLFTRYGFRCPVIAFSGAVIVDEDKNVLFHEGMPKSVACQVADFIEQNNLDCAWNAYSFENWITRDRSDPRVAREESHVWHCAQNGSVSDFASDEVHKLLCICNPQKTTEIESQLKARFPELSIVKSSPYLIEVMQKGITKALAVKRYCDFVGVDVRQTIAFGDNYNDAEMLAEVGTGYLMGNAPEPLKQVFPNHTTDNEHDGIYLVLKRFLPLD